MCSDAAVTSQASSDQRTLTSWLLRYILFLDADEFPILRTNSGGMPALLEQAFQLYPKAAGALLDC